MSYKGHTKIEEAMIDLAVRVSMVYPRKFDHNGFSEVTPSTEAQSRLTHRKI